MMERILELALKAAESAEVCWVSSEEIPVHFEANRLKAIQSKGSASVSLRLIKDGRLGYAAASGEIDPQTLVNYALETAQFGALAKFSFPEKRPLPSVSVLDSSVEKVSLAEMVELGQKMITPLQKAQDGIICDAGVARDSTTVRIVNSRGGEMEYKKTTFGLGVSGTLVRDTDMLFVGEGQESCRPLRDTGEITATVLRQLELAREIASIKPGNWPVIFTPDGLVSAFAGSLMTAFNGKTVLQGASPIGKKLGERVFDRKLSLDDDPTLDFAPNSRPCDDEGVTSQRTPLIEDGIVRNFLYDLQTAGQAGSSSTGSASRGRGGIIAPSPSAFVVKAGEATFEDLLQDIQEGLVIEQLMGAEQGNILGGDFSGNVLLGYKVEKGRIVGRVKDTMLSGNIYQLLKDGISLGKQRKWVGGGVYAPHLYCPSVPVASK
jgi:PmbA protein